MSLQRQPPTPPPPPSDVASASRLFFVAWLHFSPTGGNDVSVYKLCVTALIIRATTRSPEPASIAHLLSLSLSLRTSGRSLCFGTWWLFQSGSTDPVTSLVTSPATETAATRDLEPDPGSCRRHPPSQVTAPKPSPHPRHPNSGTPTRRPGPPAGGTTFPSRRWSSNYNSRLALRLALRSAQLCP